jgi:hypothetical protein
MTRLVTFMILLRHGQNTLTKFGSYRGDGLVLLALVVTSLESRECRIRKNTSSRSWHNWCWWFRREGNGSTYTPIAKGRVRQLFTGSYCASCVLLSWVCWKRGGPGQTVRMDGHACMSLTEIPPSSPEALPSARRSYFFVFLRLG